MLRMARERLLASARSPLVVAEFSSSWLLRRPATALLLTRPYSSLRHNTPRLDEMPADFLLMKNPNPPRSAKKPSRNGHNDRSKQTRNAKSSSSSPRKQLQNNPPRQARKPTPPPDQSELPPKGSWSSLHPNSALSSLLDKVKGTGKVVAREVYPEWWGSIATATVPGYGEFEALAEAGTKANAEKTAFHLLLAQLNRSEAGELLWPRIEQLNSNTRAKEKHALVDVFNYCAHHLLLPTITREGSGGAASSGDGGGGKKRRHRNRHAGLWKCTIALPEQGIDVMATSSSRENAEILAALKFKSAAETYAARSGVSNMIISDGASLTLDKARAFHEFLGMQWRDYRHRIDLQSFDNHGYHEARFKYQTKDPILGSLAGTQSTKEDARSETAVSDSAPAEDWVTVDHVVSASRKDTAENMALLVGAIQLSRHNPSLRQQFADALVEGGGRIMRAMAPIDAQVPRQALACMELGLDAGRRLRSVGGEGDDDDDAAVAQQTAAETRSRRPPLSQEAKARISASLRDDYQWYLQSDEMRRMRSIKADLPMNQHKDKVFDVVENNVYSIIIGATGSGKTTQVPQILLEQYYNNGKGAECNIICTQPRRIAATSVAGRVADEMGPRLASRVGHHVRFSAKLPQPGGSVTYCTTGILLQQLQAEPDRIFEEVSHLVIDEVHERDKIIDFTLTILKRAVADRLKRGLKVPRITLMSATLDTELFASYFKNSTSDGGAMVAAPIVSVPGRTFPVTERYLDSLLQELRSGHSPAELRVLNSEPTTQEYLRSEQSFARSQGQEMGTGGLSGRAAAADEDTSVIDWKTKRTVADAEDGSMVAASADANLVPVGLVATAIAHVLGTTEDGAILVFFPGLDEMQKVEKLMNAAPILGINLADTTKYRTYLLHSSIPDSQKTVFDPVPDGVRKVILSTNIGETSITIPDVKHVVDTGKARETQYDHVKRISALTTTWISKSNAKQRAGRAGRVQNGHYIGLYSRARHGWMRAIGLPELLRTDLQTTCLTIKSSIQGVGVTEFLADAIEPPSPVGVREAIKHLVDLGAFTANENLTPLGKLLASLPVHPALGKMILLGVLFRCLDPILVIGAAAEERSLFVTAPDVKVQSMRSKMRFAGDTESDHMAAYRAFCEVRRYFDPTSDGAAKKVAFDMLIHFGGWKSIHNAARQIEEIFTDAGLIPGGHRSRLFGGDELNANSDKPHIVKAVLLAGLQPNTAAQTYPGSNLWRATGTPLALLPQTSTLASRRSSSRRDDERFLDDDGGHRRSPLVVTFTNLVKSVDGKSTFLRETSVVNPMAAMLFGKKFAREGAVVKVNRWLPLYIKSQARGAAGTVERFRSVVDRMLSGAFSDLESMSRRSTTAGGAVSALHENAVRNAVADAVVSVLDAAEGLRVDENRLRMQASRASGRDPRYDGGPRLEFRYERRPPAIPRAWTRPLT